MINIVKLKMNKKAELSEIVKIILWVVVLIMAIAGVYLLVSRLTGG
jgi:uncharacterized protein (UPF0333 family)